MLNNENDRLTYLSQRMIQDSCSIIVYNMQEYVNDMVQLL